MRQVVRGCSAVTGSRDAVKGVDYSATVVAFRKEHSPGDSKKLFEEGGRESLYRIGGTTKSRRQKRIQEDRKESSSGRETGISS